MAIQKIRLEQVVASTVSYTDFGDQVEGMTVPFYQEFTATEGQTVFVLSTNYVVGNNSLKVFVNGMYQDLGADYTETSSNQVTFSYGLTEEDWVMFRIEGAGSGTTLEDHLHVTRETPIGAVNGTNTSFLLQFTPQNESEEVYKNGVLQTRGDSADYTINQNIITFNSAPKSNSRILVNYVV